MTKIALVYDWLDSWGGAERVLLELNKLFPQAPIYTSLYNKEKASWAKNFPQIKTTSLQKLSCLGHQALAPLMPLAFENFDFGQYDLVISVSSFAAKGIITKPPTKHIGYLLTPTRFLWYPDQYGRINFPHPIGNYLRSWDLIASYRPDEIVAISQTVKNRCREIYHRDSRVIYPPVDKKFFVQGEKLNQKKDQGDFFLVVSRLERQKRVDLVVKVFNDLGWPLKIVGTGSQAKKLKRMARRNIVFLGYQEDKKLRKLYQQAQALIFPQEEDFGLVALEAQASSTPIIAYRGGGAQETLKEGVTGEFFTPQTETALKAVLLKWSKDDYNNNHYRPWVEQFSQRKFASSWQELINNYVRD